MGVGVLLAFGQRVVLVCALGACGAELTDPGASRDAGHDGRLVDAPAGSDAPIDARPCMGGAAALAEPGGSCFVLFPGPKTRAAAEADCVALGGHLATIKTAATEAVVAALTLTTPAAFLGATDVGTEGAFVWPDGTPMTYSRWRTGEPNNGNGGFEEDCAVIQGTLLGVWDDRPCAPPPAGAGAYAYVCQY